MSKIKVQIFHIEGDFLSFEKVPDFQKKHNVEIELEKFNRWKKMYSNWKIFQDELNKLWDGS